MFFYLKEVQISNKYEKATDNTYSITHQRICNQLLWSGTNNATDATTDTNNHHKFGFYISAFCTY